MTRVFLLISIAVALAIGVYFFAAPRDTLAAEVSHCLSEGSRKEQCLNELVIREANDRGVERGLDALAVVYEKDATFVDNCHGATHELGRVAYAAFEHEEEMQLTDKTSYCGFGFFHGFLEALMEDTGDLSEARRFCEYVDAKLRDSFNGISFVCYHGIGHGVVDGTDTATWGDAHLYIKEGLALCDTLGDQDQHRERCASGVFNALAIAYMTPKYGIKGDPMDPYAICRAQEKQYARKSCHDQMNGFISNTNDDFERALSIAATRSEPEYAAISVGSAAGFLAKRALLQGTDLASYVRGCRVVSEKLQESCVRGFAGGFIEFGNPNKEYIAAVDACADSGNYADMCMDGIMIAIRDALHRDELEAVCAYMGTRSGAENEERCRTTVLPSSPN